MDVWPESPVLSHLPGDGSSDLRVNFLRRPQAQVKGTGESYPGEEAVSSRSSQPGAGAEECVTPCGKRLFLRCHPVGPAVGSQARHTPGGACLPFRRRDTCVHTLLGILSS